MIGVFELPGWNPSRCRDCSWHSGPRPASRQGREPLAVLEEKSEGIWGLSDLGPGALHWLFIKNLVTGAKNMVFRFSGTGYVYFLLVLLASVMLAGAAACSEPAPTATALPISPPPTETPNPRAVSSSQAQAGAPAYWSGPATWEPEEIDSLQRVTQRLVDPPFLPEHEQEYTGAPRVVEVRMEIEEKEIEVAPGVFTWSFTFNGSVPGPMIVVHEGDYVELTPGESLQ